MKSMDEKDTPYEDYSSEFEQILNNQNKKDTYLLKLYISGTTPQSTRAINNIRKICEEKLKGIYSLEIIDLYQQPHLAKEAQIIAAPTLVKKLPLPLRKVIGDMSNTERVLMGLDIKKL
jgi:circadian clock protein KaiB